MKYGVKSKTATSYLKEFDLYEGARVFVLKQQQIWKNATMQIYEIEGFQEDKLIEQFNPTKGTDYTKRKYSQYGSISKRQGNLQFGNKNKLSDLKRVKGIVRIGGYYKWDLKFPFRHFVNEKLIVSTENKVYTYKIGN